MDPFSPIEQPPAATAEDPGWFGGESAGSQLKKAAMLALGLGAAGPVMKGMSKLSPFSKVAAGGALGAGASALMSPDEAAADPAAATDPDTMMYQQVTQELQNTRTKLDEQTNGVKDPANPKKWVVRPGKGPDYDDLKARESALSQQLEEISARISSKSQFQQDEAHAQRLADEQSTTNAFRFGGAGLGAAAGAGLSGLAALMTRGRAGKFANVASKIDETMKGVPEGDIVAGTKAGDELTGLVDEAHTLRGQTPPFSKIDEPAKKGWFGKEQPAPFAPAASKGEGMGDTFEKPMSFGGTEWALPAAGGVDFAAMQGLKATTDDPTQQKLYDDAGQAGLGFAVGSKLGRLLSKAATPHVALREKKGWFGKAEPAPLTGGEAATVKAARTRLVRDTQQAGPGFASKAPAEPAARAAPAGPAKAPGKQSRADKLKLLADGRVARGAHNQALSDERVSQRLSELAREGKTPRQAIAAVRSEMGVNVPFRTFDRHYRKATSVASKQAKEASDLSVARFIAEKGPRGGFEFGKLAGNTSSAGYKAAIQNALQALKQNPEFAKVSDQDLVKIIRRTSRQIVR
jgi:hypothetical protein